MPQIGATIKHVQEGLKSMTVSAAVKNIEGWEASLEKLDEPGAKGILRDLESLKKHLQSDKQDGEGIAKLVAKLGKETSALAGKTENKDSDRVRELGDALAHAAGGH